MEPVQNRIYMMITRGENYENKSRVKLVNLSRTRKYMVFEDQSEFYWGALPVTGIKFVVPVDHFPVHEFTIDRKKYVTQFISLI